MKFSLPSVLPAKAPVDKQDERPNEAIVVDAPSKSKISLEEDGVDASSKSTDDVDSTDFQAGVKNVQASNQVWTKSHLILAYVL